MNNPLSRLTRSRKEKSLQAPTNGGYYHGASTLKLGYTFEKGNAFDNVYPSLNRIATEFMKLRPYAIDANGKPLNQANAIDCLYRPNQAMSGVEFREALAVTTLTHRKVFVLCWRKEGRTIVPGGDITEKNLGGFTILENVVIKKVDGRIIYQEDGIGREYTESEVIELTAGVDPYCISAGYSPTISAKKWATVDDYIAAYEAGHFENGAVPAGQFTIKAPTRENFDQIVSKLQSHHRGAGANNNPLYVHDPIDPNTGAAVGAQVTWTPWAQSNTNLALGEIFNQANQKIDSAYGVPASIRGVNDSNTYASVKVDERIFIKYTVEPFALRIWSKFTHELNRITGGLGYAITFDIEEPSVADEERAIAEKKKTELALIEKGIAMGYTLDSIIDAFDLSTAYKLLKQGEKAPATIVNDKPEVDEGGEVEAAPEQAKALHCTCEHDHKAQDATSLKDFRRTLNDYISEAVADTLNLNGIKAKDLYIDPRTGEEYDMTEEEYEQLVELYLSEPAQPSDERLRRIAADLLIIWLLRAKKSGDKTLKQIEKEIGLTEILLTAGFTLETIPENLKTYQMSQQLKDETSDRLTEVANSFGGQVAKVIGKAIEKAVNNFDPYGGKKPTTDGGTAKPLKGDEVVKKLRKAIEKEVKATAKSDAVKNIVNRIAETEEHRAEESASIDAADQVEQATGKKCFKVWEIRDDKACEYCQSMNGTKVEIDQPFVPKGGTIEGTDGGVMLNDYDSMDTPNAHPFCRCTYKRVWE